MIFRRHPSGRHVALGEVSLVSNEAGGHFDCYWYQGSQDDHLVEQSHQPDAEAAMAWGRARSDQVRIRHHGRSARVGTAAGEAGAELVWTRSTQRSVGPPPTPGQGRRDYRR